MSTPNRLSDELERAMPRGSREPFERRLLRLVEPQGAPSVEPEGEEPAAEPQTIQEAEERVRMATTSSEYDRAVTTLARLRSDRHEAAEPAPVPPIAPPAPPTRTVMIKEVLARDSAGLISKIKEYQITEPLPESEPPAQEN